MKILVSVKRHCHLITQILVLRLLLFSLVPFCLSIGVIHNLFQGSLEFVRTGGVLGPFNSGFAFIWGCWWCVISL